MYFKETKNSLKLFNEKLPYTLKRKDISLETVIPAIRKPCGLEYKKAPILIYGCSFGHGGWKENEHVGYFLSKETKRPVYNFSMGGKGLAEALYLIKNYPTIEPSPEYILYIFIDDQVRRLYMTSGLVDEFHHLAYEEKDGVFSEKKVVFKDIRNCFLYKYFERYVFYRFITREEKLKNFKRYLTEIKNESEKQYPNSKFVFIIYDVKTDKEINIDNEVIKDMQNMGIDVIRLRDIIPDFYNSEYSDNSLHPTSKAWQRIVPEIIKIEKM